MNKVVIYPGRFQPMLSHHVKVYEHLQAEFPGAKVLIGTADKVEGERSPFNFDEKREIAKAQGINPDNLVYAKSPYVHTFYTQIEQDSTVAIFAVGDKDKERFPMSNVDPETGLDMKVKPNKESGKLEAKYYQMINTYDEDNPVPMKDRGYLYYVPDILGDKQEVESASAFRSALINAPDQDAAKEVFRRQFKEYNEDIFNLVYNKIVGVKMNEELNILKKLAGLKLDESSPVEFETSVNVEDLVFTPSSKSSSFFSIANRFPEGSDVNDPEVKKEEFINALLKTPASLLSEINERISPSDDNGLAAGEKLSTIVRSLSKESNSIATLNDDDKKFVLGIVKKAIKEMDLHAGDDSPKYDDMKDTDFDDETDESLDLSDIRNDYGIEEGDGTENDCKHCDGLGTHKDQEGADYDCEKCDGTGQINRDEQDEPTDDGSPAYKKYINSTESVEEGKMPAGLQKYLDKKNGKKTEDKDEDKEVDESFDLDDLRTRAGLEVRAVSEDEVNIMDMDDEELHAYVGQKEEDLIDDMQQHIAPDFLHKDNFEEVYARYREEVLEPAAQDVSAEKNADDMAGTDYDDYHGIGTDYDSDDFVDNRNMVGDDEINQEESIEEEKCPQCGDHKQKLMACSSCGCSESVEETDVVEQALESAMAELRSLAGLNS